MCWLRLKPIKAQADPGCSDGFQGLKAQLGVFKALSWPQALGFLYAYVSGFECHISDLSNSLCMAGMP